MPVDYSKYPDDWESISKRIKKEHGDKCSFCGVPDKEVVRKLATSKYEWAAKEGDPNTFKIHLACIHLDHDVKNNKDSNLAPACQPCHVKHDKDQHARSRKYGIDYNNDSQLSLF